ASADKAAQKTVQVQAAGSMALTDLYAWRQMDPVPGLAGTASYQAALLIDSDAAGTRTTLDLASELDGIRSDWPDPLRKDGQEKIPLRYIHQFQDNARSHAQFALGDFLRGKLWFKEGVYQRGVLAF